MLLSIFYYLSEKITGIEQFPVEKNNLIKQPGNPQPLLAKDESKPPTKSRNCCENMKEKLKNMKNKSKGIGTWINSLRKGTNPSKKSNKKFFFSRKSTIEGNETPICNLSTSESNANEPVNVDDLLLGLEKSLYQLHEMFQLLCEFSQQLKELEEENENPQEILDEMKACMGPVHKKISEITEQAIECKKMAAKSNK